MIPSKNDEVIKKISPAYFEALIAAVALSEKFMLAGADWFHATEAAALDKDVSVTDVQERTKYQTTPAQ